MNFYLEGPCGLSSYRRDLRKELEIFIKPQQGSGSVIMWACTSYSETLSTRLIEVNFDSKHYYEVLEQALLQQATDSYGYR